MIKIKKLNKTYKSKKTTHHALKDISLDFEDTGLNFLLGKSGSGKTTLMNMIGGLDKFDSGDIIVKHLSLSKASNSDKDRLRNTVIGFIFQDFNLIEHMTVIENVSVSLKLLGSTSKEDEIKRATKAIADVGLEKLGNRKINELSGGQKQRVAIARALVKEPDILLCDEPTGNLDDDTSNSIFELLQAISRTKLVIVVSHNDKLAYRYANRVINLLDGQVIKDELTAKSEKLSTKILEYKGDTDTNMIADELLGNIDNNTIISANIINNAGNIPIVKNSNSKKSYDTKEINMFKVLFKTGFSYFTLRKVRLLVLTTMMCLSLAIGAYMIGMYTYNGNNDTVTYLEKYDYPVHELSCNRRDWRLDCDAGLYTDYLLNSDLGEESIMYLGNGILDDAIDFDILGMTNSSSTYVGDTNTIVKLLANANANLTTYFDLAPGSTNIINDNDIYITDRIAYQIDKTLKPEEFIGTTLSSDEGTFIIKGVILTNYEDVDFNTKSWIEINSIPYKYNIIIYNKNYVETKLTETDMFDGSYVDLVVESAFTPGEYYDHKRYSYDNNFGRIGDHVGIDTNIVAGRLPKNSNEVVVTASYMCGLLEDVTGEEQCTYSAETGIYSDLFNDYLGTKIVNSYTNGSSPEFYAFNSTFRDGLEIVGVAKDIEVFPDEDGAYYYGDAIGFLLEDDTFNTLVGSIVKYNTKFVLLDEDEYEYFTNYLYDATSSNKIVGEGYILKFAASDPSNFVEVSDLSNTVIFTAVVVIITLVFTLVATVVSSFNLNFIVEYKKKEIGIFKAQGCTNKQLNTIFIIVVALQTILITFISIILTTFVINVVNGLFNSGADMLYSGYELITFDIEEFLYLFICTFVFSMLSLVKPLKKMGNTEPIDVIKNL